MNDPVGRLILEREAMDRGLGGSLMASAFAHLLVVAAAVAAPLLFPREPPLKVMDGFAVVLPRGGGGTPAAEAPAPAPAATAPPETAPPEPKPDPAKIVKPPKEERKKGLPEPDAKRNRKVKPEKPPPPRPQAGGVPGGSGTSPRTPGISIGGPSGPGTPDGSDAGGDWYLASVQQKIWLIWTQQIKSGFNQPIGVTFTILADGSLEVVKVTQPSGVTLLDLAAQRAVYSAAPFGPLPKDYGTNRYTVQALFRPTS